MMRSRYILLVLLLLLISPLVIRAQAEIPNTRLYLNGIETSHFPEINLAFRAVDSRGGGIQNITKEALTITENGTPIPANALEITGTTDAPVSVVFVIDRGRYTSPDLTDEVQDVMRAFADIFQDGRDSVAILAISGDAATTLLPPTQSKSVFEQTLTTVTLTPAVSISTPTESTAGVNDALDLIMRQEGQVKGAAAVIFIGRIIEKPKSISVDDVTNKAIQNAIPIHVLQASTNTGNDNNSSNHILELAPKGRGQYVLLTNSGGASRADVVNAIYNPIAATRQRYTVKYHSTSGATGDRVVQVIYEGLTAQTTYAVNVQPPTVMITSPTDHMTIERGQREITPEQPELVFNVNSIDVQAAVTWNDNYPRQLKSATLTVVKDGVAGTAIPLTTIGNNFTIPWSLADITQDGDNPRQLRLEVADELGLTASAEVTVLVPVTNPGKLEVTVEEIVLTECEKDTNSMACRMDLIQRYAPYGGFVLMLLITLYYRRLAASAISKGARAVGTIVTSVGTTIRNTLIGSAVNLEDGPAAPLGYLEIRAGTDTAYPVGNRIELYNHSTRLGRDPSHADIVFYKNEQATVSGNHAEIIYKSHEEAFYLVDRGSSNGTRIDNGPKLEPNREYLLSSGSSIELGKANNRGIVVAFYSEKQAPVGQPTRVDVNAMNTLITDTAFDLATAPVQETIVPNPMATTSYFNNDGDTGIHSERTESRASDAAESRKRPRRSGRNDNSWMDKLKN